MPSTLDHLLLCSQHQPEMGTITIPALPMRKVRRREVKRPAQGHRAGDGQARKRTLAAWLPMGSSPGCGHCRVLPGHIARAQETSNRRDGSVSLSLRRRSSRPGATGRYRRADEPQSAPVLAHQSLERHKQGGRKHGGTARLHRSPGPQRGTLACSHRRHP